MKVTEHCYSRLEQLAEEWERIQVAQQRLLVSGVVAIGVVPFASVLGSNLRIRLFGLLNPVLVITSIVSMLVAARLSRLEKVTGEVSPPAGLITEVARLGGGRIDLLNTNQVNDEAARLWGDHVAMNGWLEAYQARSCLFVLLPIVLLFGLSVLLWRPERRGYSALAQASATSFGLWQHWIWRTSALQELKQDNLSVAYQGLLWTAAHYTQSADLEMGGLSEIHLDELTEEMVVFLKRCAPNLERIKVYTNPSSAVHGLSREWKKESGIKFLKGWK